MEDGGLLLPETHTIAGFGGAFKGERAQKMPPAGSAVGRKRLADITNVAGAGREARPSAAVGDQTSKDYIAQLLKENTALLRLLTERNKAIEVSAAELQKLRVALQKANQQNWQLAQANSQMLAELNSGKDRLKAMQHEHGCTVALLRAKTTELEEKKKLNKQLSERITSETKEESKKSTEVVADAFRPASPKKACNNNRKRTLRNQSLGSATITQQVSVKEKDESRRKSLRGRSSIVKPELCEPTEDLFEIEDVKFAIRSLVGDPMHEDSSTQPDPLLCSSSSAVLKLVKDEVKREQSCSPQSQNQDLRRSSLGRPLRKAAEKVSSYKEIPLNVKMRRSD